MALTPDEQRELNELERERLELAERGESLDASKLENLRELRRLEDEELDAYRKTTDYLIKQIDLSNERIKKAEAIKELGSEVTGVYREQLRVAENALEIQEKQLDRNAANYEQRLKEIAAEKDALEQKRKGYNDSESFAKRFTGITKEPKGEFAKFLVDPEARLEGLTEGLYDVITPTSILTSTVDKVVEATMALAIEQDAAVVNFRKATGASGEFDDNIRGLERSLFTAGVGAGEAGQAVQSLFLNVTDFTEMSETQTRTLGETVAVLNELGVASETTAKNIQFATKVMGLSVDKAAELQRELFTFAQELGVSGDKMASDFAAMGPQIAALGSKGVDAFRKLEVQAKNTGLQLSEILGIVEKFDKFDSAAESVGKLNALLGGPYLNTLELVAETDPSKRFEILKDRIDDAGLSFDTMDYYQKKAMASAMGLNEQQLALMMRGRMDLIQEPEKSAAEIEELAKQTKDFNTIMQELTQIGKMLAISFGPLISALKSITQIIQLLAPLIQNLLVPALTAAAFSFGGLRMAIARVLGPVVFTIQFITTLVDMFGLSIPEAIGITIIATGALGIAFWALSASINAALFGIPAILGLLATLAQYLFTRIASPGLIEILGLAAAAFFLLPPAILAFSFSLMTLLPLMPMLGALTMMIIGVALAVAPLAQSLVELAATSVVDNLMTVAGAIGEIGKAINEIDEKKAILFTASMTSAVVAGPLLAPIAAGALLAGTAGAAAPATAAPATAPAAAPAFTGPPPTINVNLSIDGKEFATVVNSVDVSKYTSGKKSTLYDSVVKMIEQGLSTGKA